MGAVLAHNGEINTIAGNRIWMLAREEELECKGRISKEIHPIIRPHMSAVWTGKRSYVPERRDARSERVGL
ncbi:class II glutamine amidotransferase domain protein [Leptospira santarosai str. HAI134]|nr:class II glutamine amidotransferase domain protein [Leptospira santarosai str. HAI134]